LLARDCLLQLGNLSFDYCYCLTIFLLDPARILELSPHLAAKSSSTFRERPGVGGCSVRQPIAVAFGTR
jgi:hypothetical protein